MERGIQAAGGDRIGKTIIFAQNKRHAEFIRERFCKLYPQLEQQYPGFIQRVVCDDAYAQSIIDDFKQPDKPPFIAVSVDMMDTGIDVPECDEPGVLQKGAQQNEVLADDRPRHAALPVPCLRGCHRRRIYGQAALF